jgi:hypothetical protein
VARLVPDAGRYVLVSLQRADPLPAIDRASAADQSAFLERFGTAWRQFAQIGFFRTRDLEAEARRPGVRVGVTAALMAFAARLGFEVVAVEPVRVNAYGTDLEVHPGDRSDPATWDSVRLVLARDARRVHLDYVQANLGDAALAAKPATRAWIERMAEHLTVIKAASHLLQRPAFSILRDAIVERAAGVIQDETGIEYERLAQAFIVTLHGRFEKPHRLFREDAQRSLAAAYAARARNRRVCQPARPAPPRRRRSNRALSRKWRATTCASASCFSPAVQPNRVTRPTSMPFAAMCPDCWPLAGSRPAAPRWFRWAWRLMALCRPCRWNAIPATPPSTSV